MSLDRRVRRGQKAGQEGWPGWLLPVAIVGLYELAVQAPEYRDRHEAWQAARAYCDSVGKPLLRIGVHRSFLEPPNGDVTLDLDPSVADPSKGVVLGDERNMYMFADGQFGVCFNEHTLEHLATPEDVRRAVAECLRVADYAMFLFPSRLSLVGKVLWSPQSLGCYYGGPYGAHHLQIETAAEGLRVTPLEGPEADRVFTFIPIPNFQARGSLVIGSAWGG